MSYSTECINGDLNANAVASHVVGLSQDQVRSRQDELRSILTRAVTFGGDNPGPCDCCYHGEEESSNVHQSGRRDSVSAVENTEFEVSVN
jgi:hypothetical protein